MQALDPEKVKKSLMVIKEQVSKASAVTDPDDATPYGEAILVIGAALTIIEAECEKILE